ncbi:zinc-dependent metalloprotease [Congregibacter sp.]|uniref:zinc-dependent metalloprotease n=1 Tax=Congregibacter sp. TaxID=2744308 RepID=UPI003F6C223E
MFQQLSFASLGRNLAGFSAFLLVTLLSACGGSEPGGGEQIREFAEDMEWQPGFVSFYHDTRQGKIYLLLDESNNELLYQESLPRGIGSNDLGLDRGQLGGDAAVARFEPAGDKVLLRQINQDFRSSTANAAERQSVEEAFASSVLWGFPVVARDGDQRLVDATEFLLRDSHGVAARIKALGEGSFKPDATRSAVFEPRSRAFPLNTELEAIVTFVGDDPGPLLRSVAPDPHSVTVHTHHSFIALPDDGFEPRVFHPEAGFFDLAYADYSTPIDESLEKRLIYRHRLVKKDPSAAVSDPVEPLVYYLDAGTPEPVRSALIEGASWWADAFEAAGFRDAFRVEMLPEDADPMDVRYNLIQWVHRSTRGWSYGSSVVDPRTGEILKGHVSLGSLRVRQDLLIARGMTGAFADDGGADGDADSDDNEAKAMALARIRQLSAHEVGHTLGLAHNFAASIRDRASVMDYPHPQMSLNGDGEISLDDAYATGMGDWDKRAIRYGYAQFDGADDEAAALEEMLADNRASGFEFISDPDSRDLSDFHPRSHLWDSGADPVAELHRVMKLRAAALDEFGASSIPAGSPMSDLQEALVPVFLFHRYQLEAVAKLVGGADYRYALKGDHSGPVVVPVSSARQRAALEGILATLRPDALSLSPALLQQIPPKAYGYSRTRESAPSRTGALFDPLSLAEAAAGHSYDALLHPERLARLALQHSLDPAQLSPALLFTRLQDAILLQEYSGMEAAIDRRSGGLLLKHWRQLFVNIHTDPEVRAAARGALEKARRLMQARSRRGGEGASDYADFYGYQEWLIGQALEGRMPPQESKGSPMPPGSPIGNGG